MKFNETRCHSMRVTRNKHHNQFHFDYSLHNPNFGNVQSIKYIGITITDNTKKQDSGCMARKLRKCHNHRPWTNPRHCEGRHITYLHVPLQDSKNTIKVKQPALSSTVKKTRKDIKYCISKTGTKQKPTNIGSNEKQ